MCLFKTRGFFIYVLIFFRIIRRFRICCFKSGKIHSSRKKEYSEPSEIRIENGKVVSIKKINSFQGKVSYVLPGFCDANVTLSVDSLGGQKDRAGVYLSLQSFLAHGFTGILSVGDPSWVETLLKDAQRLKKKSPWVKKSDPPWIAESSETKKFVNLPGYDLVHSSKEAISKIKKKLLL